MTTYTELSDLNNDILTCKVLNQHAWDKLKEYELDSSLARISYAVLALRCTRCGRERFDYITRQGGLNGRYYRNPIDYPKTHRHDGMTLRTELLSRSLLVDMLPRTNGRRKK